MAKKSIKGFNLTGLLIIVMIVVVTAAVVFYFLKPDQAVPKNRDVKRIDDLKEIAAAINIYLADGKDFENLKGIYQSKDQSENPKDIKGNGWIPLEFNNISSGTPISALPLDPVNNETYRYIFSFSKKDRTFELNVKLEAKDNLDYARNDSGNNAGAYEVGTDLTLLP